MLSEEMLYAVTALAGLMIVTTTLLRAWQGWLALKNRELDARAPSETARGLGESAARIEISDLRERIRKLEAIASGVDL